MPISQQSDRAKVDGFVNDSLMEGVIEVTSELMSRNRQPSRPFGRMQRRSLSGGMATEVGTANTSAFGNASP